MKSTPMVMQYPILFSFPITQFTVWLTTHNLVKRSIFLSFSLIKPIYKFVILCNQYSEFHFSSLNLKFGGLRWFRNKGIFSKMMMKLNACPVLEMSSMSCVDLRKVHRESAKVSAI